jgi:hypothetical protein
MVTTDLIRSSLRLIGAISSSETPASDETMDALEALNLLLSSWGASRFLSKNTQTITHTLTGATSYTIGSGGDINTTNPTEIYTAKYTLGGLDYNLSVMDFVDYEAIGLKNIGAIPEFIVLKRDYPLSTIYLYPTAASGTLTINAITPKTDLDTDTNLTNIYPPEWIRALKYNLAVEIAPEYGVTVSPEIAALARESKDIVMRSMVTIPKANFDPLLCGDNLSTGRSFIMGGGF